MLAPRGMLVGELIRRKSALVKRAWIEMFERRNVEGAAAVHVTAEIEAEEMLKLGFRPKRVAIAPNGVELPPPGLDLRKPPAGAKPYVLFLGRVNWKKGLDRLIPAMSGLPGVELIVAGNDEEGYQPQMQALALQTGTAQQVRFVGPVGDTDKWRFLAGARLLVLPSYNENFGIVVLEAMAAGCPVVVTPEVGLAAKVRECGAGQVVSGEADALAAAMRLLLEDDDLSARMGEIGRRVAREEFSWPAIARRVDEVYLTCIGNGSRRTRQLPARV